MNNSLSLTSYRITLVARESLDLPSYLGSTLRGAFGHAFRSVACPAPRGRGCQVPSQCAYHLIFETSPPPDSAALRTQKEIPRPFVMARYQTLAGQVNAQHRFAFLKGEELRFRFTLIGRAQQYFPYFVVAPREVNTIGRGRRAVELIRIDALDLAKLWRRLALDNLLRDYRQRSSAAPAG